MFDGGGGGPGEGQGPGGMGRGENASASTSGVGDGVAGNNGASRGSDSANQDMSLGLISAPESMVDGFAIGRATSPLGPESQGILDGFNFAGFAAPGLPALPTPLSVAPITMAPRTIDAMPVANGFLSVLGVGPVDALDTSTGQRTTTVGFNPGGFVSGLTSMAAGPVAGLAAKGLAEAVGINGWSTMDQAARDLSSTASPGATRAGGISSLDAAGNGDGHNDQGGSDAGTDMAANIGADTGKDTGKFTGITQNQGYRYQQNPYLDNFATYGQRDEHQWFTAVPTRPS
ncbi:hypothetical protein [Azospirillum argentinense]|uniref:hypothetical protein n=1 Tax=Azospirillum argentinense TaxID=2970906 RepID=UPI0011AF1947|nr:hypothetical protein [Azospirillum argentinense]